MSSSWQRMWQSCAGAVLLVLAWFGTPFCLKAAQASVTYYRVRYATRVATPQDVLVMCERAHRGYPFNYRLTEVAAATAEELPDGQGRAMAWCDIGLRQNPYARELRLRKARLFVKAGRAADGVRLWDPYLEQHYWDPVNHAVMVELLTAAGDFGGAARALKRIEGFRTHHAEARRVLSEGWARASEPPPLP